MGFTPEPGQWAFSNGQVNEYEVSELVLAVLNAIGAEIERVMWNRTQEQYYSPLGNVGGEFSNDTFTMRAYCWCDGGLHPEECPPNFQWRDVQISWYKHAGRGTSANVEISPDLAAEMLMDCLESVRAMDVVL